MQCFKSHQNQCRYAGDHLKSPCDGSDEETVVSTNKTAELAREGFDLSNRQDLDKLFERYPTLRSKLRSVYDVTQDRGEGTGTRNERLGNIAPEKRGFTRGLALLQRLIEADDADAEALRVFVQYITKQPE